MNSQPIGYLCKGKNLQVESLYPGKFLLNLSKGKYSTQDEQIKDNCINFRYNETYFNLCNNFNH